MGSRAKFRQDSESSQTSMCRQCSESFEIPSELGQRRPTKQSLTDSLLPPQFCELQKQYSEIILSYHKLKISCIAMLILNAILLVVVIVCMVFIIPNMTSSTSNGHTETEKSDRTLPRTGTLLEVPLKADQSTMSCQMIRAKLGSLYMKGQKVDHINGQKCHIDDLVDSFIQYMRTLKKDETSKVVFHFTAPGSHLTSCKDSRIRKCFTQWIMKMNTTAINVNKGSIIVPKTGVYYIYNRVNIDIKGDSTNTLGIIKHMLRHSSTGSHFKTIESSNIDCVVKNNKFSHVSYVEQVHHLMKGDELMVALDVPLLGNKAVMKTTSSSSSFGMFLL